MSGPPTNRQHIDALTGAVDVDLREIRFEPVKESRGWYFVEYRPPQADEWFATLNLQALEPATDVAVAEAMEGASQGLARRWPRLATIRHARNTEASLGSCPPEAASTSGRAMRDWPWFIFCGSCSRKDVRR